MGESGGNVASELIGTFVAAASTQSASPQSLWKFTPDQSSTPANFEMLALDQTFGAVTETTLGLGYNPEQRTAGQPAGWIKFLPNCGDSNALQMGFRASWADGTPTNAWTFYLGLGAGHAASHTFYIGSGSTDAWNFQDLNNSVYLQMGPQQGGAQFYQPNLKLTPGSAATFTIAPTVGSAQVLLQTLLASDALVTLNPLGTGNARAQLKAQSGHVNALDFYQGATNTWSLYDAGSTTVYLRDQVNGVMALQFSPAAGLNGQIKAGSVFYPVQAATASAPTYVKGGVYFDITLNKMKIGGATAWETVTSS